MRRRRLGIGFAVGAAGSIALLWLTNLPLGVPGEWIWTRMSLEPGDGIPMLLGILLAAVAALPYGVLAVVGSGRIGAATRAQAAAWLAGLWAAGFGWLWALQESPVRVEAGLAKGAWVLFYPGSEGYYDKARHDVQSVSSFLAAYQSQMSAGDVLHFGTHPPGLILLHRASINLCAWSPRLRDFLLRSQPSSFRAALDVIDWAEKGGRRALMPVDRAALWLAVLFTQAIAAATVVPLYLLVRRYYSRATSWRTAALWPLVPALAIFLPKSDALFPAMGAIFLWCWLEGLTRRSLSLCVTAGLVFFISMFLSLAILPVALAAALLSIWETFGCSPEERNGRGVRDGLACVGAAIAGWLVPVLLFFAASLNLFAVWEWNYRNHAGFYEHYHRTYWKWLLVNPLEFAMAVGLPILWAALVGFKQTIGEGWRRRAAGPYWALTITWTVLWLSGKNMGEAARLWLVILPWPIWLAAASFDDRGDEPGSRRTSIGLLVAQFVVAIAMVTRVTGFDFPTLPEKPAAQNVAVAETLPPWQSRTAAAITRNASRLDESSPTTR